MQNRYKKPRPPRKQRKDEHRYHDIKPEGFFKFRMFDTEQKEMNRWNREERKTTIMISHRIKRKNKGGIGIEKEKYKDLYRR